MPGHEILNTYSTGGVFRISCPNLKKIREMVFTSEKLRLIRNDLKRRDLVEITSFGISDFGGVGAEL